MTRPSRRVSISLAAIAAAAIAALALLGAAVPAVQAVDPPQMTARALLGGHSRLGSWMAIQVQLENAGPPISGELRLAGGAQGRTRFGVAVDLPTGSRKSYVLHVQPPGFGDRIEVALIANGQQIASQKVAFSLHDPNQLLVGILAAAPGRLVNGIQSAGAPNTNVPATVALQPGDLPERVEAWAALDRLIWQDVDSAQLSPAQIAALQAWVAGGGRLVLLGGTAGPAALAAIPDQILPYRPTATVDVPAASLSSLLGVIPPGASTVPALGGPQGPGRPLATTGGRVVAAELSFGNGAVDLIGFDPTVGWIADAKASEALWRGVIPPRTTSGSLTGTDDSQMVQAVSTLPSLALPPIGGLLALLAGYIVLIGPINYLVLRRLDRREWAWLTMPALIVVFAVASYVYGAALRGGDVLVNQVAIIRGAPGTEEGLGQVYVGIFSPTRGTYQVRVPGGALLSSPISNELNLGADQGSSLDVLQGDPSRLRDLAVGFGSLRTIRADAALPAPKVTANLRLEDGSLVGTVRNDSQQTLEQVALVLGSDLANLGALAPGREASVHLQVLGSSGFDQSLSDRIVGQAFFGDPSFSGASGQQTLVRHAVLDQLTFDPNLGSTGRLNADGPVLLAWSAAQPISVEIEGQTPRQTGQTLYYVPLPMTVHGRTSFSPGLIRATVVESSTAFFNKGPFDMSFGQGSVTLSYRPIAFSGSLAATRLVLAMNSGPDLPVGAQQVDPTGPAPTDGRTIAASPDGIPEVDIFDRSAGIWFRLPHLGSGPAVEVKNPARYVDPATGTVLLRLTNGSTGEVGFQFAVRIEGDIK